MLVVRNERDHGVSTPSTPTSSAHSQVLPEPEWRLVQRIVSSPGFVRAPRLAEFLLYICECALDGRTDEISEQQIGVHVFKRPPNYNPNEDSIVRSHARLLRKRLELYFEEDGKAEELRICIPKGRYLPVFKPTEPVVALSSGSNPALATHTRRRRLLLSAGILLALLLAFVAVRSNFAGTGSHSPAQRFWAGFFTTSKKLLIVPADSALALFEDLTNRPVHLPEYLNRRYRFDLAGHSPFDNNLLSNIAGRQYTSMADLNLAVRLTRIREAASRQIEIRYARNLQLADLKEGNAILIGGPRANPWTELFQDKMNFHLDGQPIAPQNTVINKSPRHGETPTYSEASGDSSVRAYGLLAYLPGLNPESRTLIVEGTSSVGTECASDFLLDESSLSSFLDQISRGRKNFPYFEVLLQTATIAGNAQQPEIVAYRIVEQ